MAVTETITEPVFKHILRTNKSQKQNPVGELRTRHSGNSSHLLWTGGRKIDTLVTVPALRPLAGQGSVGPASPRARARTHAHARTHASRATAPVTGGSACRRRRRLPRPRVPSGPALPFVPGKAAFPNNGTARPLPWLVLLACAVGRASRGLSSCTCWDTPACRDTRERTAPALSLTPRTPGAVAPGPLCPSEPCVGSRTLSK